MYQQTATGYPVEVRLPKLVLKGLKLEPQHAIGLTVVISDTDTDGSAEQESMLAGSALRWGIPSTFNSLVPNDDQ